MCVLVCVCVCGGGEGGGSRVTPKQLKCYWCMDVLLREHEVYVDTVKLITNIKIYQKKIYIYIYIKPYFKTALKILYFN